MPPLRTTVFGGPVPAGVAAGATAGWGLWCFLVLAAVDFVCLQSDFPSEPVCELSGQGGVAAPGGDGRAAVGSAALCRSVGDGAAEPWDDERCPGELGEDELLGSLSCDGVGCRAAIAQTAGAMAAGPRDRRQIPRMAAKGIFSDSILQ